MTTLWARIADLTRRRQGHKFSAIDFDSRQLRIVQAEQTAGGVRIVRLATADVPEGLDLADAQAVGELLGRTLDRMRLRNTCVLMDVPRGQAVLKPLILPPAATTGELAGMVQYQAEKELSFRADEAVVDFTIESHYGAEGAPPEEEGEGEHVLVAAVRRPVVDYYKQIAQVAGVRLLRLGLRPYANMLCVATYGRHETRGRVALVHVTADETEIDVMEDGGLTFSRAAVLKVPGAGGDEAAARDAVATVVMEVTRSLQSYLGVERGKGIDTILVAGGTGIEPMVAEELSRRLAVRIDRFNPAPALGLEESGPAASAFVSALGLALGQAPDAVAPFDFLDPKRPTVKRDMRKVGTIAAGVAVAAILLTVITSAGLHSLAASSRLEGLKKEYDDLSDKNRAVGAMAKRVETLDGWVRNGRNWLDQWAMLSAVFPSCTDTYITGLKSNPDGSFSFTVKAKSNDAINDLGKRLASAGYDFKPGQVTTGSDPYGYAYSTSIKVIVKPAMKVDLASVAAAPRPEDDAAPTQFGRPTAVARGEAPGGKESKSDSKSDSPSPQQSFAERYKAWQARYEALNKERPPESDHDASEAWRAKRDELRAEMPKAPPKAPPPPPPSSSWSSNKHKQH